MKKSMKVLPLLVLLFSGSAFAAPDDRIEPEERTVFESQKPVTCTADPYSKVKQNFLESHGEVGFMRYLGDSGTGVEIIGNPDTGTITILEFIFCILAFILTLIVYSCIIYKYFGYDQYVKKNKAIIYHQDQKHHHEQPNGFNGNNTMNGSMNHKNGGKNIINGKNNHRSTFRDLEA